MTNYPIKRARQSGRQRRKGKGDWANKNPNDILGRITKAKDITGKEYEIVTTG